MKPIQRLIAIVCLLGAAVTRAADEPVEKPDSRARQVIETTLPSPDEVALVRQFTVTGKLTKVIGTFSSYGIPREGGTFRLDLAALPEEKVEIIRAHDDTLGGTNGEKYPAYMPFRGPLVIEQLRREVPVTEPGRSSIHLAARKDGGTFLINIMADKLGKGSKVRVLFYREGGTFIGSMAEAEGVLE